jgi:hypothetical protein
MVENRVGEKLTEIQEVTSSGPPITNALLISGFAPEITGDAQVTELLAK